MRYITAEVIDDIKTGKYNLLVRAESNYQENKYVSDNKELDLEGLSVEEANRVINKIAEKLTKSVLPKDHDAIGFAQNNVIVTKSFQDGSPEEELSRRVLASFTSSKKC